MNGVDIVTRPGFWNIPVWAIIGIYVLGIAAAICCAIGIRKSYLLWRAGKPYAMDKETKRRWGFFVKEGLEQKRIIRKPLGRLCFPLLRHLSCGFGLGHRQAYVRQTVLGRKCLLLL